MKQAIGYPTDLPDRDIYQTQCPILYALQIIGQKWKLPILWYLSRQEAVRYNELKRRVKGVTNMMLTKSLQELEASGLVARVQYETVPPRVEYSLTEQGRALLPTLNELYGWGKAQLDAEGSKAVQGEGEAVVSG